MKSKKSGKFFGAKPKKPLTGKAFLDKIKSIGINTGASSPKCKDCGGPMLKMISAAVVSFRRMPPKDRGEESFSA